VPFKLVVVTPERVVSDEAVDHVVVPGVEGEFGVLPAHEPFLSALRAGIVRYDVGGRTQRLVVSAGFVEVAGEHVTLLARTAERAEEIDSDRATAARARAEQALQQASVSREENARLDAALARAMARLDALGK
jgi:F-type H+-transporting ATPase subunit epsilon